MKNGDRQKFIYIIVTKIFQIVIKKKENHEKLDSQKDFFLVILTLSFSICKKKNVSVSLQ